MEKKYMELGLFMRDCLEEGRRQGRLEAHGYIERSNKLISILLDVYDYSNLEKAIMDDEYRYKMFDYYRL